MGRSRRQALLLTAAGCGGTSDTSDGSADATKPGARRVLDAARGVYAQLTKDFAATSAGKGVSFDESYAASASRAAPSPPACRGYRRPLPRRT